MRLSFSGEHERTDDEQSDQAAESLLECRKTKWKMKSLRHFLTAVHLLYGKIISAPPPLWVDYDTLLTPCLLVRSLIYYFTLIVALRFIWRVELGHCNALKCAAKINLTALATAVHLDATLLCIIVIYVSV